MARLSLRPRLAGALATLMLLTASSLPAFAQAAPAVGTRDAGDLGTILTDASGMTLYTYTRDTPGTSNCYDQCATAWPPATVDGAPAAPDGLSGDLGVTTRRDGSQQLTYNGMPLYRYADDEDAEDTYGQGIGGVWWIVNPS
jgi:predicted lipoprotein with Yx(FWY)xxD motif